MTGSGTGGFRFSDGVIFFTSGLVGADDLDSSVVGVPEAVAATAEAAVAPFDWGEPVILDELELDTAAAEGR